MKKKLNKLFCTILLLGLLGIVQSCQNDDFQDDKQAENSDDTTINMGSELQTFDTSDLDKMEEILNAQGIKIETDSNDLKTRGLIVDHNFFVKAIKVSCKSPNPNNDGTYVDMSGVLLVPKKSIISDLFSYRLMVAPPPTYTSNSSAPSNLFKRMSLLFANDQNKLDYNMFYFYTLQAKSGYAVLIPDYLGYGDSYKQCVHPYIVSKPMVSSVIDLIKAAQNTLSANGYKYKKNLVITGYSQGGFVAASLARELETNYAKTYPVDLLVTGGTPCNLKQIVDIVRASTTLTHPYFLPLAIWGFQQNTYPQIDIKSILKEPYASKLASAFDGTHSDTAPMFSPVVSDLFTEDFIKYLDIDPKLAYINQILDENSVKPWVNKCKFVMTHGISDVSVYYQNAKDFADQQNAIGGKVTFVPTVGDHVAGAIPYYLSAVPLFALYQ